MLMFEPLPKLKPIHNPVTPQLQNRLAAQTSGTISYPVNYRTGDFSEGTGWNLSGNLEVLNIAIKEWVGRLAYRVSAR